METVKLIIDRKPVEVPKGTTILDAAKGNGYEMPADEGEIKAVIEEGIQIVELTAPEKIVSANGKVRACFAAEWS